MNYLDYAFIAILALGLIIGIFKGAIRATVSIVGWGVAIALVFFLGSQFAGVLQSTGLGTAINGLVGNTLGALGEAGNEIITKNTDGMWVLASSGIAINQAVIFLPQGLINVLSATFVDGATLSASLQLSITKYIVLGLSSIIIFLGTGLVFAIVNRMVYRATFNMQKNALYRISGGLLTVVLSAFMLFFAMYFINLLLGIVKIDVLKTLVDGSWFFKTIGAYNPIELVMKAIL